MRNLRTTLLAGLAMTLGVSAPAQADFELVSGVVAGGGGTSSGNDWTLTGTIGQPDAGTMTGPNFDLTGGFWGTTAFAPTCGDGMIEGSEQCDDGNTLDGDCCSATCQNEAAGSQSCGVGACEVTTAACADGVPVVCTPDTPALDDATCDGVDDDCDGTPDDGYVSDDSCFLPGECAAGNVASSCNAGVETLCATGAPASEVCDSVDNDCDGATDEDGAGDPLTQATSCGVGDCALNAGFETCVSGSFSGDTCDPLEGATTDVCNDGLDNDCDGIIDNDADSDGVCDNDDICPGGDDAVDTDIDGVPNFCDICPGADDTIDLDTDGVPDGCDNCAAVANPNQVDADADGAGDLCDVCPADVLDECDQDGSAAEAIPADQGGIIETTDGGLSIDIPAGAIADDTTISVTAADTSPSDPPVDVKLTSGNANGQVIAEFDFQPDGLTFDPPATLAIVADVSSLNANQRSNLTVYVFDPEANGGSGAFVPDPSAVCNVVEDPPGTFIATCTILVDHFSRFAMLAPTDTDDDGVPDLFPPEADNCPDVANPDQADSDNNGVGDACDVCLGAIEIHAAIHAVGAGSHPGSFKEPLVGFEVCAYDKSAGSCAVDVCGGISHQHYECIAAGDDVDGDGLVDFGPCDPVNCCFTDAFGECTIDLPPGDYIVIVADAFKTVLPDPLGVSASDLLCGELKRKHLQQIIKADGKKVPGKTTRLTGSELLIIEPEYVLWDATDQLYPFVFESIGEWGVTTSVVPPEGFVADYPELSEYVASTLEAVQFTIIEVGSDLVPTETTFQVEHNGQWLTVHGQVDIFLTSEYAQSRGFNVAVLHALGLIKEHPGNQGQGQGQGQGNPP